MDVHLELGIQRLLDLKPSNVEMTTFVTCVEDHGPSVEDDLELKSGGGCENWVGGSKSRAAYRLRGSSQGNFSKVLGVHEVWSRLGSSGTCAEKGVRTSQRNGVAQFGSLLLSPEEVFTLVVNAEAPSRASSTHQRNLRLSNTILGSEVRGLESRILGDLRNLVQLEFGDLGGDEREEDEERCEVLHGGRGRARWADAVTAEGSTL